MIGSMSWCIDTLDGPAVAFDDVSMSDNHIRHEIHIAAFLNHDTLIALTCAVWTITIGFCPPIVFQRCRGRRVVKVGVGNQNVGHSFTLQAGLECLDMLFQHGAWINHGDVAATDNISASAAKRKAAGVARRDPTDLWR